MDGLPRQTPVPTDLNIFYIQTTTAAEEMHRKSYVNDYQLFKEKTRSVLTGTMRQVHSLGHSSMREHLVTMAGAIKSLTSAFQKTIFKAMEQYQKKPPLTI